MNESAERDAAPLFASVGVSHKTAAQSVRDAAHFTESRERAFRAAAASAGAASCLVLSTCNRSEVFFTAPDAAAASAVLALYRSEFPAAAEAAKLRTGADAVRYLFRIAAGLESQVVGEDQILGQVRDAYDRARVAGTADRVMNVLAQSAIAAAKRVKTEIRPGAVPRSVAMVGAAFLADRFGVAGRRVLVIGRGQVAKAAAAALAAAGASVSVANRTRHEGTIDYDRRYEAMGECDFVVSATASPHVVVAADKVPKSALERGVKFLDLASPRDIDPSLPNVYDLDAIAPDGGGVRDGGAVSAALALVEEAAAEAMRKAYPSEADGAAPRPVVIGTRGSRLALAQAEFVKSRLEEANPGDAFEIVVISTRGDRRRDKTAAELGDDALFTRDIEAALLAGRIDLAVHSMKDLPAKLPDGLALADAWPREDPRDALVLKSARSLANLPPGAVVATGSVRRAAFLKRLRADLAIAPIRGNVDTRLRKLFEPKHGDPALDGLCLAVAGLNRLGRADAITEYLDPVDFIPAPAQGFLALEVRASDAALLAKLNALADPSAALAAATERAFLRETNAGCHEVVGAFAAVEDGEITLVCALDDARATVRGGSPDAVAAEAARIVKGGAR